MLANTEIRIQKSISERGLEVADGFSGLNTNDIVLLGSRHLIADFYVFREDRPIINFHKLSGVLLPV